jgi:ankyrin repeat protein
MNRSRFAKFLIILGADICIVNSNGASALHIACERGQQEFAQILIDQEMQCSYNYISK